MGTMADKNAERVSPEARERVATDAVHAAKNAAFLRNQYRNRCKCGRTIGQKYCENCVCLSKRSRFAFGGV